MRASSGARGVVGELAASGLWTLTVGSRLEIPLAQSEGSECVHVVYGLEVRWSLEGRGDASPRRRGGGGVRCFGGRGARASGRAPGVRHGVEPTRLPL